MKKFKQGDVVTVEDIHAILEEAKKNNVPEEASGIKPRVENGVFVFESEEEAEKYYGGFISVEDAFK